MLKPYVLLILLAGCSGSNIPALSIEPDATFVSALEQAAAVRYGDHIIHVDGLVGSFKLTLKNVSEKNLTNVTVVVTANKPEDVSDIIFSRIYHQIFWGGGLFSFADRPLLPSGEALLSYPGFYASLQGDNLEPNSYLTFDSIMLAKSGLDLHFQAYATLPDGTHYGLPTDATSVQWRY